MRCGLTDQCHRHLSAIEVTEVAVIELCSSPKANALQTEETEVAVIELCSSPKANALWSD